MMGVSMIWHFKINKQNACEQQEQEEVVIIGVAIKCIGYAHTL